MSKNNDILVKLGVMCVVFVMVAVLFTIPIISVSEPKQCITTPCDQFKMVSIVDVLTVSDNLPISQDNSDIACIEIYQPVCGADGVTYGNSCKANVANVGIVSIGEC